MKKHYERISHTNFVNKTRFRKIMFATALIMIVVCASSFYAGYTIGSNGSSFTFTISSGIYPGAATYTVWKEGSIYYAKNAAGAIDYSDTNATYVIQSAIDAIFNSGVKGDIYLYPATYDLGTAGIQLKTGVTLYSCGISERHLSAHDCVLKYSGTGWAVQFLPVTAEGKTYCTKAALKGVRIEGASSAAGAILMGDGANLTYNCLVEDVMVYNFTNGDGLYMNIWGIFNKVVNFEAVNVKNGVHLRGKASYPKAACNGNYFEGVWVVSATKGVYLEGECGQNTFVNTLYESCGTAIYLAGASDALFGQYANVFTGVWFEENTNDISIGSNAWDNEFYGLQFADSPSITDNGSGTLMVGGGCFNNYRIGFVLPKSQVGAPRAGSMYFDASTNRLYIYNGTAWISIQLG